MNGLEAATVVGDAQDEAAALARQGEQGPRGAAVARDVGEAFLRDAIEDELGIRIARGESGIDLAVDGFVYLLQPDGHILVFSAGAFEREIVPAEVTPPLVTPASFFVTGEDPESGSIFLVDTNNERIIQIDKQTGALIQQVRARADDSLHLDQLTSLYVDESASRLTLYFVNGDRILSAALPDPPLPFREAPTPWPGGATVPEGTSAPAPTAAPAATP